jgi:hypothetical protein
MGMSSETLLASLRNVAQKSSARIQERSPSELSLEYDLLKLKSIPVDPFDAARAKKPRRETMVHVPAQVVERMLEQHSFAHDSETMKAAAVAPVTAVTPQAEFRTDDVAVGAASSMVASASVVLDFGSDDSLADILTVVRDGSVPGEGPLYGEGSIRNEDAVRGEGQRTASDVSLQGAGSPQLRLAPTVREKLPSFHDFDLTQDETFQLGATGVFQVPSVGARTDAVPRAHVHASEALAFSPRAPSVAPLAVIDAPSAHSSDAPLHLLQAPASAGQLTNNAEAMQSSDFSLLQTHGKAFAAAFMLTAAAALLFLLALARYGGAL